ncbi:MAG TPA: hypothetical protein VK550_10425 [Polyangiaceae bacterium]|nr:hypothetical protein [Polyangiaceae bacterium]
MQAPAAKRAQTARFGFVLGMLAALPALVYLRGFTVDDALIPARYAANIAHGWGYRFNPRGPSTDGVTPLAFPYLLAPFAGEGPLAALAAARGLGALAWLGAAGMLGAAIARIGGSSGRYAALLLVLFSAPLGAWAWGGLETGLVVALSTAAAVLPMQSARAPLTGALLGACAWLRPEMIAYSVWLGASRVRNAESRRGQWLTACLVAAPWVGAATVRWFVWGHPAPLAVLAKPSDIAHGAVYAIPAILFTGAPFAALGPWAWAKAPGWPRTLVLGAFVHLAVIVLAGGDWMVLARLVCPVLPPLAFATAHLLSTPATSRMAFIRLSIGCMALLYVFAARAPAAAHILRDRLALIDAARPVLAGADKVATIDVGWVGCATNSEIVDLAGATDADIAALPGGHTSKAVSGVFLTARRPDRLVFQLSPHPPGDKLAFARVTEARLFADPLIARTYEVTWRSPALLPIQYVVLSATPNTPP